MPTSNISLTHVCPSFQFLRRGTTVLNLDSDTSQAIPVFLKLESCHGTVTWCRPPWADLRHKNSAAGQSGQGGGSVGGSLGGSSLGQSLSKDGGNGGGGVVANVASSVGSIGAAPAITTTSSDVDSALDTIEDAVSPGLRLKYTNRSGESIAYADEGYIELTHVKEVSLTSCDLGEVARKFAVSFDLKIVYGSSLAENRAVHFLCPPETGSMWHSALPRLSSAIRFVTYLVYSGISLHLSPRDY